MNADKEMRELGYKTIAELEKKLEEHKKLFYNISKEERESAKGRELVELIRKEDRLAKHFDYEIGDYSRNVGNYKDFGKGAVSGLLSGVFKGLFWGVMIGLIIALLLWIW